MFEQYIKLLTIPIILGFCSIKGSGQHFLLNTSYSFHQFYDSGIYNIKQQGKASANIANIGLLFNYRHFDLGIEMNVGTLKSYGFENNMYSKLNVTGVNTLLNYHFINSGFKYSVDPYLLLGYGFKSVSINNQIKNYKQVSYGLGLNFKISERIKLSLAESFNLTFKNLLFNNLQTLVGLQCSFTKSNVKLLKKNKEIFNQKIKEDSVKYYSQIRDFEWRLTIRDQKLKDSLENEIALQKVAINKLVNEKNNLAEYTVSLKNQIIQIRKNCWEVYTIYKVSQDTLIKLESLPVNNQVCYTSKYLPSKSELKNISEIKGTVLVCTNPYNYYKICIEANIREPIIPSDFLRYYPEAEIWKRD